MERRILLLGGSGLLGTELRKLDADIIAPTHKECDITDIYGLKHKVKTIDPDIIINCVGALTNENPIRLIPENIIGAANVALLCNKFEKRLVYISTDYVYPAGITGEHKETDPVSPINLYAHTKLGGECSVVCVQDHLIIRTSFGSTEFEHPQAYHDLYTSKDYVDVIAPMILKAAISEMQGVVNIGTEYKSMIDYARTRNPEMKSVSNGLRDQSMDLTKYTKFFEK